MNFPHRVALGLAVTAAVALVPATGASAAPLKGLQDQEMTVNLPNLTPSFLDAADSARVEMVRFNTRWDGKASAPTQQQVDAIRNTVLQAELRDSRISSILVVPNIAGGDSFNPRGKRPGPTAASKVSVRAYSAYIQSLATQLRDLPVNRFYSAVNEPNWYRHLPKRGGATMYRRLHNTAYTQIKRIDPKAKILLGELAPYARPLSKTYPNGQSTNPGSFMREVLGLDRNWKSRGSSKTFTVKADGVSLHTYDFKADPRKKRKNRDDWTHGNLSYAKADLRKAARTKRLPSRAVSNLYLTEFAYKTSGSDSIPVSRANTYLRAAWNIAKRQKTKSFLWYQLRDPSTRSELWQSGLQSRTGTPRATWRTFVGLR